MAKVYGTHGNDHLMGTAASDRLNGRWGVDMLHGLGGDDLIHAGRLGGMVSGGNGDDIIHGYGFGGPSPQRYQTHLMGGFGNDVFKLHVGRFNSDDATYRFGHHVFGGQGNDRFEFIGLGGSNQRVIGRIDDFDPSRDTIWVDGQLVDLYDPPENVRVVALNGQQWLLIDERILYSLDGARHRSATVAADGKNADELQEDHFIDWPRQWSKHVPQSATVRYHDPVNAVPEKYFEDVPGDRNRISASSKLVEGTSGADFILGAQNVDNLMRGGQGGDYIWANRGDDTINGGAGADTIDGFFGNDVIYGQYGKDIINGNKSHDLIYGGPGNDTISGGLDNDTIHGGIGWDLVFGGSEHDKVFGNAGNDRLFGGPGNDTIFGSNGHDKLYGDFGNDILRGGSHNDLLDGGSGHDRLAGGTGEDSLTGGWGQDLLLGGEGVDLLRGGPGEDTFIFHSPRDAPTGRTKDTIVDFQRGIDTLDLHVMDANVSRRGNQAFDFSDSGPAAHSVWVVRHQDHVILRGDVTGDGNADFAIKFLNESDLREADILM
jgi:Ca2+-binding RTX toxin-like protein